MTTRKDGQMIIAIGVSRSGKSVIIKRIAEKRNRVIGWDPKGEYAFQMGFDACTEPQEFLEKARATTGAGKIAFISSDPKHFELFCQVAFNFNRQAPAAIICEELAAVTGTAKAAGAWGRLINQGLAYEPLILATVQRGQEVDKSIMNNASFIHVAMHNTDDDAAYIARKLGVDIDLIPRKPLEFFQWRSGSGVVCSGKIDFKGANSKIWQQGSPQFRIDGKLKKFSDDGRFVGVNYG